MPESVAAEYTTLSGVAPQRPGRMVQFVRWRLPY